MDNLLRQIGNSDTCSTAIITRNNKVFLGLRHYHPRKMGSEERETISVWTTPGGRCDEGETLHETLVREVYEEVGIKNITVNRHVATFSGAKTGDTVYVFQCTTEEDHVHMEPEKFSEWRWFAHTELPENIISDDTKNAIRACFGHG